MIGANDGDYHGSHGRDNGAWFEGPTGRGANQCAFGHRRQSAPLIGQSPATPRQRAHSGSGGQRGSAYRWAPHCSHRQRAAASESSDGPPARVMERGSSCHHWPLPERTRASGRWLAVQPGAPPVNGTLLCRSAAAPEPGVSAYSPAARFSSATSAFSSATSACSVRRSTA